MKVKTLLKRIDKKDILLSVASAVILFLLLFNYLNSQKSLSIDHAQGKFMLTQEKAATRRDSTLTQKVEDLNNQIRELTSDKAKTEDSLRKANQENIFLKVRAKWDSTNIAKINNVYSRNFNKQLQMMDTLKGSLDYWADKQVKMEQTIQRDSLNQLVRDSLLKKQYKASFPIKDEFIRGKVHVINDTAYLRYELVNTHSFENIKVVESIKGMKHTRKIEGDVISKNPNAAPKRVHFKESYEEQKKRVPNYKSIKRKKHKLNPTKRIEPGV